MNTKHSNCMLICSLLPFCPGFSPAVIHGKCNAIEIVKNITRPWIRFNSTNLMKSIKHTFVSYFISWTYGRLIISIGKEFTEHNILNPIWPSIKYRLLDANPLSFALPLQTISSSSFFIVSYILAPHSPALKACALSHLQYTVRSLHSRCKYDFELLYSIEKYLSKTLIY